MVVMALGVLFLALDILDIHEDYRLYLPIPLLNTVFLFVIAVFVAYFSAKNYVVTGAPILLGLGCASLFLGLGRLFKCWMTGLDVHINITIDESATLLASIIHLVAAGIDISKRSTRNPAAGVKSRIILGFYLGVLVCFALIVLLVLQGRIPLFSVLGIRGIISETTAVFFLAAAVIGFITYYRSRGDFYYWYSLGLVFFSFGVMFMGLGAVESKLAWSGRISQYLGNIFFLVSVLSLYLMKLNKNERHFK